MRYKLGMKSDSDPVRNFSLKTFCLGLLILLVVAELAACSGKNSSSIPATVTESSKNPLPDLVIAASSGKPLFSIHCSMCHGEDGSGEGLAGGSLALKPTDLTAGKVASDSDGKLFLVIKNGIIKDGKQTMPPAKKVADEQIWQIVAYMRSLVKK